MRGWARRGRWPLACDGGAFEDENRGELGIAIGVLEKTRGQLEDLAVLRR